MERVRVVYISSKSKEESIDKTNNPEVTAEVCDHDMDENSTTTSYIKDPDFRPQKESLYNKLLPYADEIEAESQTMLRDIKENLGLAVMLREMRPGCITWCNRLYKYIYLYGLKFSKEDHIIFVKLMYELVTLPGLDADLSSMFSTTLVLLLKKKELISPDELELPWRPLYQLTLSLRHNASNAIGLYRYPSWLKNTMYSMIRAVKTYFPLSATQEILDELRPMLCPFDGLAMCVSLQNLECFLPLQLPPRHYSIGHQLWFDEFMTMWKVCHNAPLWENDVMWLMARLATYNIGRIDWEPHLPLMFTRFVRCLNLPVSYKKSTQNHKNHKIDVVPITLWITAVLGNGSNAQAYLEKFLKTIETYFHPANLGPWLGKLRELLIKFPYYFILRLHKERYAKPTWETPIPDNHKLTDSDIDAFVKSIMPVALTAMYSKLGMNDACCALQYLATIRPNLVIPDMLERMYSTFDSLTEPHKLIASITCMVAVAKPMVQGSRNINKGYTYPDGPTHVLPLLFSCLPGIDPNDIGKCFATFRFISVYATLLPIADLSKSTANLTEEERLICEATSRFEDFILQFLDRIFTFIDSSSLVYVRLENRDGDIKSKLETVAEMALSDVCMCLLVQTSDAIFQNALHKLRAFVTERILETKVAGQLAAVVCKSFARFNGRDTLRALVPVLTQTILHLIGEGDDMLKEENLNHGLLHSMLLLSAVVYSTGDNLVPYIDTLIKVLDRVLLLGSIEINKLACGLLKTILLSLSTITPCQYRSAKKDYNDLDYPYVRDWGQSIDIDTFSIKWYVPGEEEAVAIERICSRYLITEMVKLTEYCKDPNTLSRLVETWINNHREKLFASLNIVCNIIRGVETLLPVWNEAPLELLDSSLEWTPFSPMHGSKMYITIDEGNIKRYIVDLMSKVQQTMLENSEDDTKSFFLLIRIWSSLLLGKVRLRELHDGRRKNFQITKRMFEDKLVGNKGRLISLLLERCDIQQEARVVSQSIVLTETHKQIMLKQFALAISRYADVRSKAQSSLFQALKYFPYSYTFIVPQLIDILAKDTEEHHDAYKGVLYMLFGPQQNPIIIKRDWTVLRTLWPAVVLSKTSEKPSVIRLRENIVTTVCKYFFSNIEIQMSDTCVKIARALWEHFPRPIKSQPDKDEIEKGAQNLQCLNNFNLLTYTSLLDELLRCILEESLHWRHRLMAMSFIRDLVQPDQIYSAKIIRYFLQALIHESLGERKIAIRTVVYILKQQKRIHSKITINIHGLSKISTVNEDEQSRCITPGIRADNFWLQYNYKTRPLTAEQWDEARYVHKPYIGYYSWPKNVQVYAPSSQQPCLDPKVRELTEYEKEIDLFFNNPQNIEKLIDYLSLEEKKGKDRFNLYRCLLFKGVFRNHGIVYLKHFVPHLQRLVIDKHESSQRCLTEIIAGIIQGSKHWPFRMTCDMWEVLLPIIKTALSNLTEETVMDWGICFMMALQRRDPNRYHWLLECLMDEPSLKDSETSFVECGRLYILQNALTHQIWRVTELLQRLMIRLENRLLTSPFQNVRERLGWVLVTVFDNDLRFPQASFHESIIPRMQTLIDKIVPRLKELIEKNANKVNIDKNEESCSEKMAVVPFNESKEDSLSRIDTFERETPEFTAQEQEVPLRLLKTVCKWIISSLSRSAYGATPGFYEIFPVICLLQNSEADEELSKLCLCTLAILAQALTLPEDMPVALNSLETISKHSSWSARLTSLEFLQVLVFHNMGIILSNESWVICIKNIVLHLLADDRLEVREKASQVLGGLLHCTFIADQEELLEEFKGKARLQLHKKNKPITENETKIAQIDAIRLRHAGVLGLCAFIRAHPYDVPKYVPPIFEHLSRHMNDPQPIPVTIRKTLNDFKRTHYDNWTGMNGHAQNFTEEQLTVLQDLTVPPPHYV